MIPALGIDGAAALHAGMTEHITMTARAFLRRDRSRRAVEIRFSGTDETAMREWLGAGFTYVPQDGGDVGERTRTAFQDAFDYGAGQVIVIGTDVPGLTAAHLSDAFAALHLNDVVIGPSTGGGYYLLGINARARFTALPAVLTGVAWGTGFVLGNTISIIKRLGLTYTVLDTLAEVERPEDLPVWERIRSQRGQALPPAITAIVPTCNHAAVIDRALGCLETGNTVEVIVADGGSTDDTVIRAINRGVYVVESSGGRAHQLNAGLGEATGDYVLLLDPGTTLPPGFDRTIRNTLGDSSVAGGAFTMRIDSPGWRNRLIERAVNFAAAHLHLPCREQGLFMRTSDIFGIGGVPDVPASEDFTMARRLSRLGRIAIVKDIALTSAPRWSGGRSRNTGRFPVYP